MYNTNGVRYVKTQSTYLVLARYDNCESNSYGDTMYSMYSFISYFFHVYTVADMIETVFWYYSNAYGNRSSFYNCWVISKASCHSSWCFWFVINLEGSDWQSKAT